MIGLHISKSKMYEEIKHAHIQKKCGDFNVTLSYHELDYRQVSFEDGEVEIFIDGWIFNSPCYENQASFVAEQYSKFKYDFTSQIEGQFNLFVFDKKMGKGIFLNDIFAFRKHFICEKSFVISSDIKFLYSQLEKFNFNRKHIQKNLNRNRFIDIRETFVEGISMVTPASIIDFIKWKNYSVEDFESKYSVIDTKVTPSFFLKEVKKNIQQIHKKHPLLLQLSGGMDSRFLLENMLELGIPTKALIYGNPQSDELAIARKVAMANDIGYFEVEYKEEDYIKNAAEYAFQTGGLDIFVQSAFNKTISSLNAIKFENCVFETGIGLNNFIGGTQINKQYVVPSNSFSNEEFDLTSNDIYASRLRIFSQLVLRQSLHREFMDDRYSMFSYQNYFLMKSIPFHLLKDYSFYKSLAEMAVKNSREVPIQATMLPFYAEADYSQIELLKKQERKSLLAFIQEKKLKPHNRYYSDFDMWLRADSGWRKLVESSILDKNAGIFNFVSEGKIRKVIEEHNKGANSHMRLIIRLISTELFIKETLKYLKKGNE